MGVIVAGLVWRNSLLLGGSLGLATSLLLALFTPKDEADSDFRIDSRSLKLLLSNGLLILLSIAMLGIQIGSSVVRNFRAYYLGETRSIDVGEAGVLASLSVAPSFIVGPLCGRV